MKLKAFVLSLMMVAMMLPIVSFAQNDNIIQNWDDENGVRDFALTWAITNNSFGTSPLGSGLLILTAVGAGYAVAKRRRNRKSGTMMLLAALMLIGMTNCKKNQAEPQNTEVKQVRITLDAGGHNGAKHTINTSTGAVEFEEHDLIYVGNNGKYIGTLECNDKGKFEGEINEPENNTEMYLYFVGGLSTTPATLVKGSTVSFTVDISDQSTQMPVLSSNHVTYYTGTSSYSCELQNHCALVKFTIASTTEPVQVGGLYTVAQIDFANNSVINNGTTGFVALNPESATEKWAVLLPQTGFDDAEVAITNNYVGYKVDIPNIDADAFITDENAINITDVSNIIYLQWITEDYTATNGQMLKGTLAHNYCTISIAAGATVTLDGVDINSSGSLNDYYAGITCEGDATINLSGTNIVKGLSDFYPGIFIPNGYTLTIQGTGTLTAMSGGGMGGAGIGGGHNRDCGNILIKNGIINATSNFGAGIGGGQGGSCGFIKIQGGTVTATGGTNAAGIGSGQCGSCGNIDIQGGTVSAMGGFAGAGIGTGTGSPDDPFNPIPDDKSGDGPSSCGTITISGGIVEAVGLVYAAGIGTASNGNCGNITITNGVTRVTATKSSGDHCIGTGHNDSGFSQNPYTVTIDGRVMSTIELSSPPTGDAVFTNFTSAITNYNETWTLTHK